MREKIYKLNEMAKALNVHPQTLQRYSRLGLIPNRRTVTNRRYFLEEDYQKLMQQKID